MIKASKVTLSIILLTVMLISTFSVTFPIMANAEDVSELEDVRWDFAEGFEGFGTSPTFTPNHLQRGTISMGEDSAVVTRTATGAAEAAVVYTDLSKALNTTYHKYLKIKFKPSANISTLRVILHKAKTLHTGYTLNSNVWKVDAEGYVTHVFDLEKDNYREGVTYVDGINAMQLQILETAGNTGGTIEIDWIAFSNNTDTSLKVNFEGMTFFQKNDKEMTELSYNDESECFEATDGIATISDKGVMPSEKYSMVQRYTIPTDGKYRVRSTIYPKDTKGGGDIVRIYKNGEIIREQLCPSGEKSGLDVRVLCQKNDTLDIEVSVNEYVGYNYAEWNLKISRVPHVVLENTTSTTVGKSYGVLSEKSLAEFVGENKPDNVDIYLISYNNKIPMEYDTSKSCWKTNQKYDKTSMPRPPELRGDYEEWKSRTQLEERSTVSGKSVVSSNSPISGSETFIDIVMEKDATLVVDGEFNVINSTDGELIKLYLNREMLWTNRNGGEVSIRFDEPYDTKFFINNIHYAVNVKKGDTLSFGFSRWRKTYSGESIDISDIKIKEVVGEVLSVTTKWKLNNSIVVDTINKSVFTDGKKLPVNIYIDNYTTYISTKDIKEIFATDVEGEFVPLREYAEGIGNTVVWAADRYVIIHKGIPGMYTLNELSEIKATSEIKGGALFD